MTASTAADAASYKERKEAFVSNLSGGSITEINLVTLVAAAAILLWSALQSRGSFFNPYTPVAFLVDFLLNICALLFAITFYSSAPVLLNILLTLPALLLLLPLTRDDKSSKPSKKSNKKAAANGQLSSSSTGRANQASPPRPFLTHYRGGMMVITCLAILAVDFPIFPRRFAKTENWGTSLMDLGVGSFVFSAGVVSAKSVLRSSYPGSVDKPPKPFLARFATATKHSIPLLVLGFVRLWSVKGLDYAEHVTEYGVHWNFFFTLALLPPFVEISDLITTHLRLPYSVLSFLLAATYQVVLDTTSLKAYILISPRGVSLLSKNREGIFSFIGYLSIFLSGRSTGILVLANPSSVTPPSSKSLLPPLALQTVIWTTLYTLTTTPHLPFFNLTVSRRLANLPYVLWVASFNVAQLFLFVMVDTFSFPVSTPPDQRTSHILGLFNRYGLPVFLLANLMTGLVNLSVDTLDMGETGAMVVLIGYAMAVTAVAGGLEWAEKNGGWRVRV